MQSADFDFVLFTFHFVVVKSEASSNICIIGQECRDKKVNKKHLYIFIFAPKIVRTFCLASYVDTS